MGRREVTLPGGRLEMFDRGSGEPVVFIQTALTADELIPIATDPSMTGFRSIVYYRRGYGQSTPVRGAGSIVRDAADCASLLEALRIPRAHVIGLSYSGAVALQLAVDVPALVQTLTLIEPPPVHIASADTFRAANDRLLRTRHERGVDVALDEFLALVTGLDWRTQVEALLPGSSAQMERDAAVFFDTDLPALLSWEFDSSEAARVRCPILYVGGSDSGRWFDEVRELMLTWFPDADDVVIDGADHSLAVTQAPQIARAVAAFLGRNPIHAQAWQAPSNDRL